VIERSDVLVASNAMYNVFTHQLGPPVMTHRSQRNIRRATTAGNTKKNVIDMIHVQHASDMMGERTAITPTFQRQLKNQLGRREERLGPPVLPCRRKRNISLATTAGLTK
jgi:hypothetical protein